MPQHSHSHSHSHSKSGSGYPQPHSIAAGIHNAAQALGSVGAPTGNLRTATQGTTSTGTDVLYHQHQYQAQQPHRSQQSDLSGNYLPSQQHYDPSQVYQTSPLRNAPPHTANHGFPQHQASRRTHTIGHADSQPLQQYAYAQHQLGTSSVLPSNFSPNSSTNSTPGISQQQVLPSIGSGVPGILQAGGLGLGHQLQQHQYASSPGTVSSASHMNTNAQQYTLPTRSNTMAHPSHSHSRSSPAGLDQRYVPFSAASSSDGSQKYPPQTPSHTQKYYAPQTPTSAIAQSPLALDQIRPRANSSMNDDGMGGSTMFNDFLDKAPSNSNYLAPWAVFAFDWCKYPVTQGNSAGKMAIGSYLEDPHNFIQIVDTQMVPQEVTKPGDPAYGIEYTRIAEATCSYPVTRILWEPPISQKQSTDLLATSGDHLRLWSLPQTTAPQMQSNTITRSSSVNARSAATPQKLTPLALLSNSKQPEYTAPLTSLDWNTLSPKLIITSSIDTTCTIWDIPTLTAKTQLIAHDKEVFDVRFCAGSVDVFVSCGADGSVRMFDLRSLEHSTIIYEPSDKNGDQGGGSPERPLTPTTRQQTLFHSPPLLRLAASPHDTHLLATFAADSNVIRILDVRQPGQALLELKGHNGAVNAIEWSPTRRGMLASGADDSLVLLWDLLSSSSGAVIDGELAASSSQQTTFSSNSSSSSVPVSAASSSSTAAANQSGGSSTPAVAAPAGSGTVGQRGPFAAWNCDFEVANLSWASQSGLTQQGGEWLGVAGGRGIWSVKV